MKKLIALLLMLSCAVTSAVAQKPIRRHTLPIPDTLAGIYDPITHKKIYYLEAHEGVTQFFDSGQQTKTSGYNQYSFLGPTLIMHNGDSVQMFVHNKLNDTTTVHWHGIHLPAPMDGGPHQPINPGCTWSPYWTVKDHAATYWYHPHLMETTDEQVYEGLAGLIIIRDKSESSLRLPRTYGVDDIPLVITDRMFLSDHQFVGAQKNFTGDVEITNGVFNAECQLPKQIIRFRMLNASIERLYNIGFCDSKKDSTIPFFVIGSDGGLLNDTVRTTRYLMAPGQRVELLLDLTGRQIGETIEIMAFNNELDSTQDGGYIGVYPLPNSPPPPPPPITGSFIPPSWDSLQRKPIDILHIKVKSRSPNSITKLPHHLLNETYWDTSKIKHIKYVSINLDSFSTNIPSSNPNIFVFTIDGLTYTLDSINKKIYLNDTVIWTVNNHTVWNHVFHIHDIQFHILNRYNSIGANLPLTVSDLGLKDDVNIDSSSSLRFITVFNNYATFPEDTTDVYMYHCHMLSHEDAGMMGQFQVLNKTNVNISYNASNKLEDNKVSLETNFYHDRLYVKQDNANVIISDITVMDNVGRIISKYPHPVLRHGIDIRALKPGEYTINIVDTYGKKLSKKFTKN